MENIRVLNEFKSSIKKKKKYGNEGIKFKGLVTYDIESKQVTEILECLLINSGYHPRFEIDFESKGKIITDDKYSLIFSPLSFEDNTIFKYEKSNHLFIIEGVNAKNEEKYKITISEI